MQAEDAAAGEVMSAGNDEFAIGAAEEDEAAGGDRDDDPDREPVEQHGGEDDLQKIERDERVGRAAGQVELHGQRRHVEQQLHHELCRGDAGRDAVAEQREEIERGQRAEHDEELDERQRDAEHHGDIEDGHDLAEHCQRAKLDQQQQVLAVGRLGRAGEKRRR